MNERIELAITPDEYILLPNCHHLGTIEKDLTELIKNKLKIRDQFEYEIIKKSIDARRRDAVFIRYQVYVYSKDAIRELNEKFPTKLTNIIHNQISPVVVGLGPAGLFAALKLAQKGLRPVVIERGCPVDERVLDVDAFLRGGKVKAHSNVQFGEGGAGTFSDGKLYSGVKNKRKNEVLQTFVAHGAPQEIQYQAHPHIGSDRLRKIIPSITKEILRLGGMIHYKRTLSDVIIQKGRISAIVHHDSELPHDTTTLKCNILIIAPGHSARETFSMLYEKGVNMSSKPFAIGVRIEHRQEWIDRAQYGKWAGHVALPAAIYKLAVHPKQTRSLYSFCMCPGGFVVPSASDESEVVTNGMSFYDRDAPNANAALLVPVDRNDFPEKGPLSGMFFQKDLEEKAFMLGGKNGYAPCQKVADFLSGKASDGPGEVLPSYLPGVRYTDLSKLFSQSINKALIEGILEMSKKIKSFSHPDALLTAVETRSSSPVRILRDQAGESISIKGLFPCGEGAGYAGGIMSSAMDGIRIAEHVFSQYKT